MTIFETNKEIQRGERILQKGYVQEALTIFDAILEKDPGNNLALNDKGVALNQLNKYDQAIEIFQNMLNKNVVNPTVIFNLISNHFIIGHYQEAEKIFNEYGHILTQEDSEKIQKDLQTFQIDKKYHSRFHIDAFHYPHIHERLDDVHSKKLFFIMGVPKSGTTWVQHLLNGHPEINCSGEGDFNRLMDGFKDMINDYNLHISNINENIGINHYLTFTQQDLQYLFISSVFLLLSHLPSNESIQWVGSKNPILIKSLDRYPSLFPTSKFIHIIRDGRDVIVSAWFNNLKGNKEDTLRRWPDFKSFITFGVQEWISDITKAQAFGNVYQDRYIEVRYEDLHQDPSPVLRRILDFLGVHSSPERIEQCIQAGSFEVLSQGRQRGQEDRNAFFRKGIIGDWKNHFDHEAIDLFMQHGGKLLEELGYIR
jgi:tetratricopeptide (TPR) repeat protein